MLSRPSHRNFFITFLVLFTILGYLSLIQYPKELQLTVQELYHSTPWTSKPPGPLPTWFLGIFSGPGSVTRRHIIRSTWASRYTHPSYEYRFMIGNYTHSPWAPLIDAENATYGDIWAMTDYTNENYETANEIKNMEFFSHMSKQRRLGNIRRYDFVSKVDDDNWLNLPVYRETFMDARLPGGDKYAPDEMTMIARPFMWSQPFVFPAGRIYTVSWPLVEFYAGKYANPACKSKIKLTEDQLMGFYLDQDKLDLEFVVIEYEQAYDIGVEFIITNITDTMMVHSIKSDTQMLDIGTLFDDRGRWNGRMLEGATNFNRTAPEMVRRFGKPNGKEMQQLREAWAKPPPADPLDSLDWKLVYNTIQIENRTKLGNMYPLNLKTKNNNVSTGCVPMFFHPPQGPPQG